MKESEYDGGKDKYMMGIDRIGRLRILRLSIYISFCQGFQPPTTIDQVQKVKSHEKPVGKFFKKEDERVQDRATMEAFIAMDAQSPYDADGIQLADQIVVTELKRLSEFKQSYMKKHIDYASPGTTGISATPSLKMSTLHKDTSRNNTIFSPLSLIPPQHLFIQVGILKVLKLKVKTQWQSNCKWYFKSMSLESIGNPSTPSWKAIYALWKKRGSLKTAPDDGP
ncbi:hypothetical protein LXL04_034989 [Taraxacum kok-saghyz]